MENTAAEKTMEAAVAVGKVASKAPGSMATVGIAAGATAVAGLGLYFGAGAIKKKLGGKIHLPKLKKGFDRTMEGDEEE